MPDPQSDKWSATQECRTNRDSMINLFVGKKIGGGASRRVYEMVGHPDRVLKVEHTGFSFHNHAEWAIWNEVKHWPISDWFAKCIDIDSLGNVLMQQRTTPFKSERDFKDALVKTRGNQLPSFFADVHYGNFGMLNDVVVCHDYGYHHFISRSARQMSIELGYLEEDKTEVLSTYIKEQPDQYALNL